MQCNRILRSIVMWNRTISNGSAVLKRSTHSATSSSSIRVGTTSSSSPYRAQQNRNFSTVMKPAEEEQVINVVILYIYDLVSYANSFALSCVSHTKNLFFLSYLIISKGNPQKETFILSPSS